MPTTTSAASRSRITRPLFARVVCGIDGGRLDTEVVRQAALLAGGGALELVAVTNESGLEPWVPPEFDGPAARAALEAADAVAASAGAGAVTRILDGVPTADVLLDAAHGADLLVVGGRGQSRATGILLGSTSTKAAHAAPCPVLIARPPQRPVAFPAPILLADAGTPSSTAPAALAAELSARHGAAVYVVAPLRVDSARYAVLRRHFTALADAGAGEPELLDTHGSAPDAIVEQAARIQAGLIVIGSRGRRGVAALSSVSERVAHRAPCSVLITRP